MKSLHKKTTRGKVVQNKPCPSCRDKGGDKTGDHLMIFEDGGNYCTRCERSFNEETMDNKEESPVTVSNIAKSSRKRDLTISEVSALPSSGIPSRGLTEKVVHHYGVKCEKHYTTREITTYYFPIYENGELVGYKPKHNKNTEGKFNVTPVGALNKRCEFFGQQTCKGSKKKLIICEGQEDAMAAWLMLQRYSKGGKYEHKANHVISLNLGSKSGQPAIKANWKFLCNYKEIILAFDNDEPGQETTVAFAKALGHKKVKVMSWGDEYKDPNAMLQGGSEGTDAFISAYFEAKEYVPTGLISGADINFGKLWLPLKPGLALPYKQLNEKLGGARESEVTIITGVPGAGKSSFARGLIHSIAKIHKVPVGIFPLEENLRKASLGQAALHAEIPFKQLSINMELWTPKERKAAEKFVRKYMTFSDNSFGNLNIDLLIDHLHYMVYNKGIKYILLDHINMIVSGTGGLYGMDEKDVIDYLMKELAAFVTKTGAHIFAIAHLNRNNGSSNMKGASISMSDLRGSSGLEQLSFNILTLTRDLTDEENAMYATLSLIKNREWAELGFAGEIEFNKATGWYRDRED